MLRRKAQVAALSALWSHALPTTPASQERLTHLLIEAEQSATSVASALLVVLERIQAGHQIAYPWSYVRGVIRAERKRANEAPASHETPAVPAEELQEMTPAFAQELAQAKEVAKQLWGE